MWLLYSSWNVKLTAEKEAYTTKSVQITNYIKAKSTLRHIYMIQMYVYNSILAGRLGDCWLAPGRLLAGPWEAAGWPLGRLTGPWEGCYWWLLLGGCWLAPGRDLLNSDFRWFWWFLLLLLGGGSSFSDADFLNALSVKLRADADFSVALTIWLETVVAPLQKCSKISR